jgi:hypothetical protein
LISGFFCARGILRDAADDAASAAAARLACARLARKALRCWRADAALVFVALAGRRDKRFFLNDGVGGVDWRRVVAAFGANNYHGYRGAP